MWLTARRRADECGPSVEDVEAALLADRAAVLELLDLDHADDCAVGFDEGPCDCGLDATIDEILEKDE